MDLSVYPPLPLCLRSPIVECSRQMLSLRHARRLGQAASHSQPQQGEKDQEPRKKKWIRSFTSLGNDRQSGLETKTKTSPLAMSLRAFSTAHFLRASAPSRPSVRRAGS